MAFSKSPHPPIGKEGGVIIGYFSWQANACHEKYHENVTRIDRILTPMGSSAILDGEKFDLTGGNMIIREEHPEDRADVYEVEALAFGRNAEADLVDELRKNGKVTLSLVAEEGGKILGHVLFSPGWIEGTRREDSRGRHGTGRGSAGPAGTGHRFRHESGEALKQMRQAGRSLIIVEGNPRYYIRFGFINAALFGITCEFNPPPGCFMVRALAEGALEGVSGTAHYAEEFRSVG